MLGICWVHLKEGNEGKGWSNFEGNWWFGFGDIGLWNRSIFLGHHAATPCFEALDVVLFAVPHGIGYLRLGTKYQELFMWKWLLGRGVTRSIYSQTLTSTQKFVILIGQHCNGYLVMGCQYEEFWKEVYWSTKVSPGVPMLKLCGELQNSWSCIVHRVLVMS